MPTPDRVRTRFLVVGSGIAGLHTAWRASQHGEVLLLTKRSLFDSATAYAQGGIAAALGAGDSPTLHRRDTLAAGAALCDAAAVEVLVEEGPARVRELQTAGAEFALDPSGELKLGREAAHSTNRIVHAHVEIRIQSHFAALNLLQEADSLAAFHALWRELEALALHAVHRTSSRGWI